MAKSDFNFSTMPTLSLSRSKFVRGSQHKTSMQLGLITPIYWDDIIPGDTVSFDMAALVRMSTPVVPIMDNIKMDIYAFFVPKRLVWDHFKGFFGENLASYGIPAVTYTYPQLKPTVSNGHSYIIEGGLLDYLGLPIGVDMHSVLSNGTKIRVDPVRSYYIIYDRWFRNQNLIAPTPIRKDDNAGALLDYTSATYVDTYAGDNGLKLLKASKLPDYFTKALPYAQKGNAVTIPLGTTAPIYALVNNGEDWANGDNFALGFTANGTSTKYNLGVAVDAGGKGFYINEGQLESNENLALVADLSTATAATINELRYAFQLQKLLERDALYGSRFWELLAAHFGVTAPDASLQDPEYLGGMSLHINIDQVLATAASANDDATTDLGQPGANSVSGTRGSLFTKSFVEPGILMVVAVVRHEETYSQGIAREWNHFGRYDDYWPVFANLGAQEIRKSELMASGTSVDREIFGYQEAWAEYRYKKSIITGKLRPASGNTLNPWTLGQKFTSTPTLSASFIEADRTPLTRALLSGNTGPDFICDFAFTPVYVRPMPTYSIPGLIDHH